MNDTNCRCSGLGDLAVIDVGQHAETLGTLEQLRKRGQPYWWLTASVCQVCATAWLIAQEERQNDIFILKRLRAEEKDSLVRDGQWPADFDRYETLLEIGLAHGRRVRFADVENSSLRWTVVDLARERPGISVSRLATLLNLAPAVASKLARKAVAKESVEITIDV